MAGRTRPFQKADGIFAARLNPWDRLAAGLVLDAAREARKGNAEALLWLDRCAVDLLGALLPSSVEPEQVIRRLMQDRVSL